MKAGLQSSGKHTAKSWQRGFNASKRGGESNPPFSLVLFSVSDPYTESEMNRGRVHAEV